MEEDKYYERFENIWNSVGCESANMFALELGFGRSEKIRRLDPNIKENKNRVKEGKKINQPGIEIIEAILKKYPQVNANYIFTGKGDPTIKPETEKPILKTAEETVKMDVVGESYGRCLLCAEKSERIADLQKAINIIESLLPEPKKENPPASRVQEA